MIFAKSGTWWVQPTSDQPFTAIDPDSTWKSSIHLGTEYAALLVEPQYRPPAKTDVLPAVGGGVLTVATEKGREVTPAPAKTIQFSGYDWVARSADSDRGGWVNAYDPANAWTDENGFLHLRIAKRAGRWTGAEVRLARSLGYGSYSFVVHEIAHLPPTVVLGMFTWDDTIADPNHRELDIEITRWGDPASKNAQYVVQPYYVPTNVVRFTAPPGTLTHSFHWEQGRAAFKTVRGNGAGAKAVADHVFTSGIPTSGGESVHLNLYIFGQDKDSVQNEVEVVVEKFQYLP
ncbi:MAG TPA: hypothetical protein VM870_06400 [Pyrinomonadaceae bacterium]|nr:hypothetical protein [Pyrinomonadaceae bacterium]